MRLSLRLLALLLLLLLAGACHNSRPVADGTLYQVSTIDALLAGAYDGVTPLRSLRGQGDFGIGTFHGLDGEMLVLDGVVYQVRVDGSVHTMPPEATTPFAVVSRFEPVDEAALPAGATMEGLAEWLDARATQRNLPLALRIDGRFRSLRARSVPAQEKPYPPLAEVARHQAVFEMTEVAGSIVGYRTPDWLDGVGVPGYHLHFLMADRSQGGHVLAFELAEGTVAWQPLHRLVLELPSGGEGDFARADLSRDRSAELEQVEK